MPQPPSPPWPAGAATGVGSMPGGDVREAVRVVLGEVGDLPYLPELPARGPGADLTGRTLALLPGVGAQWGPTGWALADRPGGDLRRAAALLAEDLDALEEIAAGWVGAAKVQACGPWTLAATVELRTGRKALSDAGAVRDLGQALVEGLAAHLAGLRRRLPGARLVVQLDEPALPAVLAGTVPTPSGWGRLVPVEAPVVEGGLRAVLTAVGEEVLPVVHCCAADPPVGLLRAAGARALSLDAAVLAAADAATHAAPDGATDEQLATALESGVPLLLGLVPARDAPLGDVDGTVAPVRAWWRRIGLDPALLAQLVVPTPTCGLAAASPGRARAALARCRAAGQRLLDDPEPTRG